MMLDYDTRDQEGYDHEVVIRVRAQQETIAGLVIDEYRGGDLVDSYLVLVDAPGSVMNVPEDFQRVTVYREKDAKYLYQFRRQASGLDAGDREDMQDLAESVVMNMPEHKR